MTASHADRIAVVTGAARGIGQALALGLAARGARVAAVDVLPCAETVASAVAAGGRCVSLTADIADEASVATLAEAVHAQLGPVAILVNNAAVMGVAPFPELDAATFRRLVDVNLHGPFH